MVIDIMTLSDKDVIKYLFLTLEGPVWDEFGFYWTPEEYVRVKRLIEGRDWNEDKPC